MKNRVRFLPGLFGAAAIIVIGLTRFVTGPTFQLQTIYVAASPDIFPDYSVFQVRANVLFLATDSIAGKISRASPFIKSVRVDKQFPSSLLINIEERLPVVVFHMGDSRWFVDGEGVLLPEIPRFSGLELPLLVCQDGFDAGGHLSNNQILMALRVAHDLFRDGTSRVSEIRCEESTQTLIMLIDGVLVTLPAEKTSSELSQTLLFLFKQFRIEGKRPKSVDLRFEKPVLIP